MKILAVRGKNLASLAKAFELNFADGPLAQTGLFAITGRTGAGKSTILDAMCLALFDRIPRLRGSENVRLTDDGIMSNDVRRTMRIGAAHAFAEVDFRARDNRIYRARWEVKRARDRAEGRLTRQHVTLTDVTSGQMIGERKRDTLEHIKELLGLDFDQFRRSVLLAQNEFAAFLDAKPNERAALLERITGAQIYARISEKIFDRHKEAANEVKELQRQGQNLDILDDETRATLQTKVETYETRRAEREAALKVCEAQLAWYDALTSLSQACQEAEDQHQQAYDAQAALAAVKQQLADIESVRPLQPHLTKLDQAQQRLNHCTQTFASHQTALQKAHDICERTNTAVADADIKLTDAKTARDRAEPKLIEARNLDAKLTTLNTSIQKLEVKLHAHAHETQKLDEAVKAQALVIQDLTNKHHTLDIWRKEHQAWGQLAADWRHWREVMTHLTELIRSHTKAETRIATLKHKTEQAAKERERCETQRDAIQKRIDQTTAKISEIQHQLDTADDDATLQATMISCTNRCELLTQFQTARNDLDRIETEWHELVQNLEHCETQLQELARQRADLDQARPTLEAQLEEAERALDLAIASRDLADHRRHLKAGEPCPLCGAEEHPFAEDAPIFKAAQQQRVDELRSRRDQLNHNAAEVQTRTKTLADEHQTLGPIKIKLAPQRNTAIQTLADLKNRVFADTPLMATDDPTTIADLLTEAGEHLDAAKNAIDRRQTAKDQQLKYQTKLNQDHQDLAKADQPIQEWRDTQRNAESEHAGLIAEQATRAKELADHKHQLSEVCSDAEISELIERPQTTIAVFEDRVSTWRTQTLAAETHAKDVETAQMEYQKLIDRRQTHERNGAEPRTEHEAQVKERERRSNDRNTYFDGTPVDQVTHQLKIAVEKAETTHHEASQAHQQAAETLAAAKANHTQSHEALTQAQADQDRHSEAFEQAVTLANLSFSTEDIKTLLNTPQTDIEARKEQLKQAYTVLTQATTRLDERQTKLAEHQQTRPEQTRDALTEQHQQLKQTVQTEQDTHDQNRLALTHDTRQRAALAELTDQIRIEQQQLDVLATLNDLIGSAAGDKFRRIAQSLTLDWLVDAANHHLNDLFPRYALARMPGQEMTLWVVDRHMADEKRNLNTLSGGERFLTSLALALGLAGLTAEQKIESLFIDEGFGALDAESLDTALSVLETLAEGRTIGVISHVQSLTERIGVRIHVGHGGRVSVLCDEQHLMS